MLNKTLLGLSLVAAFSTASLSVQADEYHVVVPAPGKAAPYASIKLELNPASLPVGVVGDTYAGFDFNSALRITGDPELDMSQVKWVKYTGDLPYGLTLSSSGSLSGMPAESDSSTFQALTKYKTKTALGTYTVQVNDIEMVLSDSLSLLEQGQSSTIDLDTLLFVTGDPAYQAGMASWDIRGALPAGLIFSDGTITGTPSGYGSYPITVQASYKKRLVEKTVNIEVERVELTIVNTAGVRTWEDGSVANSCQDY